jgi:hypothetical protein
MCNKATRNLIRSGEDVFAMFESRSPHPSEGRRQALKIFRFMKGPGRARYLTRPCRSLYTVIATTISVC